MPERSYWRAQVSAFIEQKSAFDRETYIINDADPDRHPTDARLVVRAREDAIGGRERLRRFVTHARRCGFVVVAAFGISAYACICDRDPLAYSYSSDHSGIIGEAEPAAVNGGDR